MNLGQFDTLCKSICLALCSWNSEKSFETLLDLVENYDPAQPGKSEYFIKDKLPKHPIRSVFRKYLGYELYTNAVLLRALFKREVKVYGAVTTFAEEKLTFKEINELIPLAQSYTEYRDETFLHLCNGNLNIDVLRLYLHYGADPNARDRYNRVPLEVAYTRHGFIREVELLAPVTNTLSLFTIDLDDPVWQVEEVIEYQRSKRTDKPDPPIVHEYDCT